MFRHPRDPRETLKGLADEFRREAGEARYRAAQFRKQKLVDQGMHACTEAVTWEKALRIVSDRIATWDTLGPPPAA